MFYIDLQDLKQISTWLIIVITSGIRREKGKKKNGPQADSLVKERGNLYVLISETK